MTKTWCVQEDARAGGRRRSRSPPGGERNHHSGRGHVWTLAARSKSVERRDSPHLWAGGAPRHDSSGPPGTI